MGAAADSRRRLPASAGGIPGGAPGWTVAKLWRAAYTDAPHVLAAGLGLSPGSTSGVAVAALVFKAPGR